MWVATIDDTGVSFRSLSELARFLGCARSNINWYMNHTKEKNHFYYQDIGITIKKHKRDMERRRARSKEYYQTHKAQCLSKTKLWRANNKDKVKEYKEKWRIEHKEWFNAYYREQRRKRKKQMVNEAAFELVCNNMKESNANNKKVFARYILGEPLPEFEQRLMDAWAIADGECQERLAMAFPQLAVAMLEYNTLPDKKRKKYLRKLLN